MVYLTAVKSLRTMERYARNYMVGRVVVVVVVVVVVMDLWLSTNSSSYHSMVIIDPCDGYLW